MDIARMTDEQIAAQLAKSDFKAIATILAEWEPTAADRAALDAAS